MEENRALASELLARIDRRTLDPGGGLGIATEGEDRLGEPDARLDRRLLVLALGALGEARAGGATAFHDSIVLGLYQFRALAGKKALVVLTDGKDNHSSTDWPTLRRYARTAGVPIFVEEAVLAEAGISAEDIAALRASGAVA